ncbi:hypothetical protein AURDEDRAFT_143522 [Auricularia subglabra TFB-10046 SS5]|nr:hypothetical protein AURDEDRAFT_143522 [Auricularia subglabra TFB-10046 SS5]
MLGPYTVLASACVFVSVINYFVLVALVSRHAEMLPPAELHAGNNFQPYLIPPNAMPRVALDVEESVHFGLGRTAMSDWEDGVETFAWYKIGPNHHMAAPTMYHERHCLRLIHRALFPDLVYDKTTNGHAQHCLSYLRQMTLCRPDLTLEPPDVLSHRIDVFSSGRSTHVCGNWSLAVERGHEMLSEWRELVDDTNPS